MSKGYAVILAGYVGWGLLPLYWVLLRHVPAVEVLLHRIAWSVPVLLALVLASERRRRQIGGVLGSARALGWLAASAVTVSLNWGIFIWAVANERVVEASMGYFLTPLLNVIGGVVVFRERLARLDLVAVGLAAAGVLYYIVGTGLVPWAGIAVGISFAAYGLMRKRMPVNAVPGLLVEVLLLLPFTLALMLWLHQQGGASFLNHSRQTDLWLILAGPVTVVPLALFTAGTRLLPMTTVGVLFYVTPSLQFLTGVAILGEPFDRHTLLGFAGIWCGLALFTWGLLTRRPEGAPKA